MALYTIHTWKKQLIHAAIAVVLPSETIHCAIFDMSMVGRCHGVMLPASLDLSNCK